MSGRAAAVALGLVLGACHLEVDYVGALCDHNRQCPAGYECDLAHQVCALASRPCDVANGGCDPAAVCAEQEQSWTCACPEDLAGDGLTCTLDDTRLAALAVTLGDATPDLGFSPRRLRYELEALPGSLRMVVTPVAAVPASASVTVDGHPVASGAAHGFQLVSLAHTCRVVVTNALGASTTYTVEVSPAP